jgi:hypothetical protein
LLACLYQTQQLEAQEMETVSVKIQYEDGNESLISDMEINASLLLSAINKAGKENKKLHLSDRWITDEAKKKIEEMWKTSKMLVENLDINAQCMKTGFGDYQIRNISVFMKSADADEKHENISLNFNEEGQISDINFSLDTGIVPEIIADKASEEDFNSRSKILDFIEKLRTAYNCKDIDYISNVYSNNALIITAVKRALIQIPESDNVLRSLGTAEYEIQVKTKAEYISRLGKVFKKNKYVNIVFDSVQIEDHPGYDKVYGVTLKQHWDSSTYNDVGFLYLLIDCRKEYEMQIFVRAWSPEQMFSLKSFSSFVL